jgi:hypothetical protein
MALSNEDMENRDIVRWIDRGRPAGDRGYPPGATLGPRSRHDFEFVWVVEGDAEWTWLDRGQRLKLTPWGFAADSTRDVRAVSLGA